MAGYAGEFFLATAVDGHPAETLVQVTVSALYRSRLVLAFEDEHQVLTDARVLLCGHIGALKLTGLGYTGPLARRPPLAAAVRSQAPGPALTDRRFDGTDAPNPGRARA